MEANSLEAAEVVEGRDVMSQLLVWQLDLLVRQVLLCLDVTSLRACRQV